MTRTEQLTKNYILQNELSKTVSHKYPYRPGMEELKDVNAELIKMNNLTFKMIEKGATDAELARVAMHSFVILDCAKRRLDYKKSEEDDDICGLIKKYMEEQ